MADPSCNDHAGTSPIIKAAFPHTISTTVALSCTSAHRTLQWGCGVANPEAMYNLCMILETMLQKLISSEHCLQLHLYTYKHNYVFRDSPHLNHKVLYS